MLSTRRNNNFSKTITIEISVRNIGSEPGRQKDDVRPHIKPLFVTKPTVLVHLWDQVKIFQLGMHLILRKTLSP